jgi:hypothetical protein
MMDYWKARNKQYVQILNQKLYKTSNVKNRFEKYNETMKSC